MEIAIIILLIITGILLIVLEVLVIPGIAIAGIGGVLFMAGGVYYAYSSLGSKAGNITLVASIVSFVIILVWVLRSKTWDKAELHTNIDGIAHDHVTDGIQVGDQGTTISRLAPMGKIRINDKVIEAKSITGYINPNEKIEVLKIQTTNVIVKLINN